jgi:hypothetical protein|tara:strand:+ start:1490 stop:1813 length:324 start_codon:yes stop_codon:yes gene_type:complete
MANSKDIIDEFLDIVWAESESRWGEDFTVKDLVYHLIENGIIPPKALRNYMMFNDFDKFIVNNEGHIGNTFIDISIRHGITEKQCRNIIYKQRYKTSKDYNIMRDQD